MADQYMQIQFLIERPCPVEGGDAPVDTPFPVWVYWPSIDPPTYAHEKCDATHYRLTQESATEMGCVFGGAFVCEHMGHLIE